MQANTAQMNTPSFVDKLKTWIRFSDQEAIEKRDGLSAEASGNPSVQRWLGSHLFSQFYTPEAENEKYAKHIRSSSVIAIFSAEIADKKHWIEVGRCYQRFALQATTLNIRNAFISQPIEVATFRLPFAQAFGLNNQRVDLIVRFGRGSTMQHSLRRPIAAVLV